MYHIYKKGERANLLADISAIIKKIIIKYFLLGFNIKSTDLINCFYPGINYLI